MTKVNSGQKIENARPYPWPNRKRMTLIAAFRCKNAGNQDEVVFCADRQQSSGDFRNWVDKLCYGTAGEVDYVMGGAGHGTLIDAFLRKLAAVLKVSSGRTKQELQDQIQWTLKDFHKNEYKDYPAANKDKRFACLIGLRHTGAPHTYLWKTDGPILSEIQTYALTGHEDSLYEHEVERIFRPDITTKAAIRLGVHLLKLAGLTSLWVGGPTQVILLQPRGIYIEEPKDIEDQEKNLSRLREIFDEMLLSVIDSAISKQAFEEQTESLVRQLRELRSAALQQAGERVGRNWRDMLTYGSPYQVIPSGGSVTFGLGPSVLNEVADIPDHVKEAMREAKEMAESKPPSDAQKSEGQP